LRMAVQWGLFIIVISEVNMHLRKNKELASQ
jgi:hypothetical protein